MEALEGVGLNEQEVAKKLVGFGCDGANVMIGKNGAIATLPDNSALFCSSSQVGLQGCSEGEQAV